MLKKFMLLSRPLRIKNTTTNYHRIKSLSVERFPVNFPQEKMVFQRGPAVVFYHRRIVGSRHTQASPHPRAPTSPKSLKKVFPGLPGRSVKKVSKTCVKKGKVPATPSTPTPLRTSQFLSVLLETWSKAPNPQI